MGYIYGVARSSRYRLAGPPSRDCFTPPWQATFQQQVLPQLLQMREKKCLTVRVPTRPLSALPCMMV